MESSRGLIIRGVLAIGIGVIAFFWPGITLAALVVLFAAFAFLDGILHLVLALGRDSALGRPLIHLLLGVIGMVAGVLAFFMPILTLFVLVLYIAAWAIVRGILEIAAAVRLRHVVTGEWLLATSGILSVIFGFAVFAFPAAGALAVAWLLGIYAIATGILLLTLGFSLRRPLAA